MSNKGDLTQVTIEAGVNHTQEEVMIVSTDSSAHVFVQDYAEAKGYAIKEVPYGSESVSTREECPEQCILDAEQTGITSSDLCEVFSEIDEKQVMVRIFDEDTGKATVAMADVITHYTKDGIYEITGFLRKKHRFAVEFQSTTSRTFVVESLGGEGAEELAWHALDCDGEISEAWKDGAKLINKEVIDAPAPDTCSPDEEIVL